MDWPSPRTRRTISYLTWTRSRLSKKSDEAKSGSRTLCGWGLRLPCWRRASTFGSAVFVLAIGSPVDRSEQCKANYAAYSQQVKRRFARKRPNVRHSVHNAYVSGQKDDAHIGATT